MDKTTAASVRGLLLLHGEGLVADRVALDVVAQGRLGEALRVGPCLGGRVEVDGEGEDVSCEDEGDDPLEVGRDALVLAEGEDAKGDAQGDLDEDEGELDPEGDAEDAVLSVLCFIWLDG